jgi:hypothetical protein
VGLCVVGDKVVRLVVTGLALGSPKDTIGAWVVGFPVVRLPVEVATFVGLVDNGLALGSPKATLGARVVSLLSAEGDKVVGLVVTGLALGSPKATVGARVVGLLVMGL